MIGILGKSLGWELLLKQIGVEYTVESSFHNLEKYKILISTDNLNKTVSPDIIEYLQSGGAFLCSSEIFEKISTVESKEVYLKYLPPQRTGIFTEAEIVDIYSKIKIPSIANSLVMKNKRPTTFVGKFLNSDLVVFPFSVEKLIIDQRTSTKNFYTESDRMPYEIVSLVSKGSVRRLVKRALEYLYYCVGLNFSFKWYYPKDAKSLFVFRIDTDYAKQKQIIDLYRIAEMYNIPVTWFVDTKSQQNWLTTFADLQNVSVKQEIGVHCYEHKVYNSYADNYANIKKASNLLNNVGIYPRGFASPFGIWNYALAQAVRDIGFLYSSEFSYDYDNLPSESIYYNNLLGTLQIPIHPICIGSMHRQGFSRKEMTNYFLKLINKNYLMNEPIILYHHPTHENLEVIENIFIKIKELNIPTMSMSDYATWWKKRITSQDADDVFTKILQKNGKEIIVPKGTQPVSDGSEWKEIVNYVNIPDDIERTKKFNKWVLIHKLENYLFGRI